MKKYYYHLTKITLLASISVSLSGCFGTIVSRFGDKDIVGKYPYSAIVFDSRAIYEPFSSKEKNESGMGGTPYASSEAINGVIFTVGLLSLPLDLSIDTILIPFDLIFWPFGYKKKLLGGENDIKIDN